MRTIHTAVAVAFALCLTVLAATTPAVAADESVDDLDIMIEMGNMRPFFEVDYGMATPKFKGMTGSFATIGILELKLGYTGREILTANVIATDDTYVFGSYLAEDVRPFGSPDPGEDLSRLNRFGFGNRLGYGYDWGRRSLELYNQNSINWTTVRAADYPGASAEAQAIFDRYGTQYRFGELFEAGAKFHVTRNFALTGGFEGAVIFPRYVFWPWLGSVAIYSVAEGAVEMFADRIMDSSPTMGPVMAFLLKNGLSLGYYLLMRDDMAWPFDYEQPLTVESYKLGASLSF